MKDSNTRKHLRKLVGFSTHSPDRIMQECAFKEFSAEMIRMEIEFKKNVPTLNELKGAFERLAYRGALKCQEKKP